MKKMTVLPIAATLLLSVGALAACSSDKTSTASSSQATTASTTTASKSDVVSTASISDKPEVIEKALSSEGNWIVAVTSDMTLANELTVSGQFHDKGKDTEKIYRKWALYTQDAKHVVTARYTVTVPKVVVASENFNIVNGTVKGNIEVKANGFVLNGATVEGNIIFDTQAHKDSANLTLEGSKVTGEVSVAN